MKALGKRTFAGNIDVYSLSSWTIVIVIINLRQSTSSCRLKGQHSLRRLESSTLDEQSFTTCRNRKDRIGGLLGRNLSKSVQL